jgi:hypothetical protein
MFNPFYLLNTDLLHSFIDNGKKFFVRQTYNGIIRTGDRTERQFIFSHYPNISLALDHFGAIENDRFRYVYDWNNEEHRKRLLIAASQPVGFKIWSAVFIKDWEKLITKEIEEKVRKYIKSIGWTPLRNDIIKPLYYLYYGHLYIELKFRTNVVRIKFEEIEKMS